MAEKGDDNMDVDMSNTKTTFDNLIILKELGNIINSVRNEDFLEIFPNSKFRRVKWIPMFNCLKEGTFDEMVEELSSMWEYEKMPEKLERPQLGDVKAQLRARDVANLRKQKALLESLTKEYEVRVNRLKKTISAKRGYIKVLQMEMQKYQKKNDDFIGKVNEKLENHASLVKIMVPDAVDIDDIVWTEKDMET
ncbi:Uncharacterized protein OBRU01_03820 [Operophtera brumata]|uniref:Uncharacterized protein n=1 Tax=Operophtera brumata TaxID=104452 RepID=A0A0L7LQG6_OPEBR|nr:Uncharacterized protein OBRU01_03820 [Operophtera brumata]